MFQHHKDTVNEPSFETAERLRFGLSCLYFFLKIRFGFRVSRPAYLRQRDAMDCRIQSPVSRFCFYMPYGFARRPFSWRKPRVLCQCAWAMEPINVSNFCQHLRGQHRAASV